MLTLQISEYAYRGVDNTRHVRSIKRPGVGGTGVGIGCPLFCRRATLTGELSGTYILVYILVYTSLRLSSHPPPNFFQTMWTAETKNKKVKVVSTYKYKHFYWHRPNICINRRIVLLHFSMKVRYITVKLVESRSGCCAFRRVNLMYETRKNVLTIKLVHSFCMMYTYW